LKLTVLDPCVAPKFVPVIATDAPTAPEAGDRLVMFGAATTVKLTPLLLTPPTVTTTLPVVAPLGTGATIDVTLQLVGVAVVPLNLTVLVPCVAPKPLPLIVIVAPTAPDDGAKLLTLGVTVNFTPLLEAPPTVTTTLPVVAALGTGATIDAEFHFVGLAATPLKVTVLVPCVEPKFFPVIVTDVPTTPDVGERLVMEGALGAFVRPTALKLTQRRLRKERQVDLRKLRAKRRRPARSTAEL